MKSEKVRKAFGARLKRLRKQRGWTQKDLGEKLGIRFSLLNKYEGGVHVPPLERLIHLADIFETSVDYLVTGREDDQQALHNRRLLERFRALEDFQADDQEVVIKVIDAMIVKRRAEGAVAPIE
jgi:transcriptional regulator with XRE-family HTH domain